MTRARKLILYLSTGFGLLATGLLTGAMPAQADVTDPRGAQRNCTVVNDRSTALNVRPDPSTRKRPVDIIYPGEFRFRFCSGDEVSGQAYRACGRGRDHAWYRVLTSDSRVGYVAARCATPRSR